MQKTKHGARSKVERSRIARKDLPSGTKQGVKGGKTPTPGGPIPIPYPNTGSTSKGP